MRLIPSLALLLTLAACDRPPAVAWAPGDIPATPELLPLADLAQPGTTTDPGPALQARAQALRASLGL